MIEMILLGILFIYKVVELILVFALWCVLLLLLSVTFIFWVWFKPMRNFYLSVVRYWKTWAEQFSDNDVIVI